MEYGSCSFNEWRYGVLGKKLNNFLSYFVIFFERLNMNLIKPALIAIFSLLLASCMYGNPRDISKLPANAFTSKNTGLGSGPINLRIYVD
jgi:hypothetical protein